MTLHLQLKPETERTLRAAAEAHQVPAEDYLLALVESALHPSIIPAEIPAMTKDELDQWFKDISKFGDKVPHRPDLTYSREQLYDDHD
jgi:hypothetical protein